METYTIKHIKSKTQRDVTGTLLSVKRLVTKDKLYEEPLLILIGSKTVARRNWDKNTGWGKWINR